jgi:hypothetical protein
MQQLFYHSPHVPRTANNKKRKQGRVTIVAIIDEDGIAKFGASKCDHNDNFSRKVGRHYALNRAANSDTALLVAPIPNDINLLQWFRDTAYLLSLELLAGQTKVGAPL